MKTFRLTISSPDGTVFSDEVVKISLRGMEGDLAILAGHTPFVTAVKPCDCIVELAEREIKKGFADGGILTVSAEGTTLLSGSFTWD